MPHYTNKHTPISTRKARYICHVKVYLKMMRQKIQPGETILLMVVLYCLD